MEMILIIVLVVLLFGGGGYWVAVEAIGDELHTSNRRNHQ